jgi:heme exporter protein D
MSAMFDFDAGKYAMFVWPAYGVTALLLAAMALDTLARSRRWRRTVERREAERDQGLPP